MPVAAVYHVRVRPGRMADFLDKERTSHEMARRLGAERVRLYQLGAAGPAVNQIRVVMEFGSMSRLGEFLDRAATDPDAIAYNAQAKTEENPSEIIGFEIWHEIELTPP